MIFLHLTDHKISTLPIHNKTCLNLSTTSIGEQSNSKYLYLTFIPRLIEISLINLLRIIKLLCKVKNQIKRSNRVDTRHRYCPVLVRINRMKSNMQISNSVINISAFSRRSPYVSRPKLVSVTCFISVILFVYSISFEFSRNVCS